MMGRRENARNHTMAVLLNFIKDHPDCTPMEVCHGTGISKMEVYRYLKQRTYEFRSTRFLLRLREENPIYYQHLISDARYTRSKQRRGFLVNLSKRDIFEKYCFKMGYLLVIGRKKKAYLVCFANDYNDKCKAIRF